MKRFSNQKFLFIFQSKQTQSVFLKSDTDSLKIKKEDITSYDLSEIESTPIFCKNCLEIMRLFKSNINNIGGDLTLLSFFFNENKSLDENLKSLGLDLKGIDNAIETFKTLVTAVKSEGCYKSYSKVYLASLNAIYSMEKEGLYIKEDEFKQLQIESKKKLITLNEQFLDEVCNDISFGLEFDRSISNPEFIDKLFFCKNTIKDISQLPQDVKAHAIALEYLKTRSKIRKVYGSGEDSAFGRSILHNRIFSKFSVTDTVTGRTSSSEPNIQNLNKEEEFRHIFRRDGYKILSVDINGAELYLLACFSDDKVLKDDLLNEVDVHLKTAKEIARTDNRKIGKAINFGLNYGMSANTLFAILHKTDESVTLEQCQEYIRVFFEKKVNINKYFENIKKQARERGKVITDIHEVRHTHSMTQALNYPLQRGCAVICLLCMDYFYKHKLRLFNFVHDEFFFYIKEGEKEQYLQCVKEAFKYARDTYNKLAGRNLLDFDIKYSYKVKESL